MTRRSGVGICSMGVMRPDLIMRSIIPVVMAGVLGIYGLITAARLSFFPAWPVSGVWATFHPTFHPARWCTLVHST